MHPSLKIHLDEKRTLKTAPEGRIQDKNVMIRPIFKKAPPVGGRPCPSGQTHGLTDGATPPSAELSHPGGFRRPPCPPVPCLGNPESQAALPEVRLHDASSGGHINRIKQPLLTFTDGKENATENALTAASARPGAPAYTRSSPPQRPLESL
jgi:hypothetical protein